MMAVTTIKSESVISLRYVEGIDTNGKNIVKSQNFSKIRISAVNDDIYEVGEALGSLLKYPVLEIYRKDEDLITPI
jgi:hypothetical protein